MNKTTYQTFSSWWYVLCLLVCCGSLSSITPLKAQEPRGWEISLAAPGVGDPTNVTANGFTANWSNVYYQQYNDDGTPWNNIFFRLLTTREIEAKSDGIYKIVNTTIKPNPDGQRTSVSPGQQTLLDGLMSQTAWSGQTIYWTPGGFSIAASDYEGSGIPEEEVSLFAQIASPVLNLTNADGKYTVEFTAKALNAKGNDVKMLIYGYGEELDYRGKSLGEQTFRLPNDGQTHKFSFDLEGGTWCHRVVIQVKQFAEVEFSGDIVVKQNLKKGDKAFRSTFYGLFSWDVATHEPENLSGLSLPELYSVKYSFRFDEKTSLDPRALDLNAAKADGERVAYRLLYGNVSPGPNNKHLYDKSMYSAPAYFDDVEEPNNYLYVGYCNYEAPNYNGAEPSGPSWAGYHGGAIKLTKELLKEHVGSKVVGIRFASAACKQLNQVNDAKGFLQDTELPCIFLAKSIRVVDKSDYNNPKDISVWDPIIVTPVDKLEDGWNTLFFDKPYEITAESEFFAGAYAYDAAAKGGIVVRSYQSSGVDPNSAWLGTNWSTYNIREAEFYSRVGKYDGPLLMQIIIQPKAVDPTVENRGELRGLSVSPFVFSDEDLKPTIDLFNTGIKAIKNIKVETDLAGNKQEQTIELSKALASSLNQEITLEAIAHEGISGEVTLTVKLLEVNGVALKTPSVQTAKLEILKRDEAFKRITLVEVFTSEACQYCPEGVTWLEEIINKPDNASIKRDLVFVQHHSFFRPDWLSLSYSQGLAPFYGIKNLNGDILFVGPSSPTNMFNRKPLPELGDAKGTNGSIYTILRNQGDLEKVAKAAEVNPAAVRVEVKPWFKEDEQKLNVVVQGRASQRLDQSRPVYMTLMITQDKITPRSQQFAGNTIPNFVHSNVLRYVDEGGFQGTKVEFDEKGNFKVVKDLTIATTDAKSGNLPPNTLLLEGDNKSLSDVMKHVNVIAFLHYYTPLPTKDDVEDKDPRLLGNEVLNVGQRRVSFTSFEGVEGVDHQDIQVTVQDGTIRVNVPVSDIQVYDVAGRRLSATGLQAGVYVIRLVLLDGSETFVKVIAE
ncbi:hypothetical protein [uncultured Porphyromonas sp.]|uniref:hypothetical protein n=1 Tax=uncultured Porphyromonas sp. TaxID=159274 RepID=UPI0025F8C292|nr:hypothetical protein [uncultured Porphyromonas sp.]